MKYFDEVYKIPLTLGLWTLVDKEVYEEFGSFKWYAEKQPNAFYAARTVQLEENKYHFKLHRIILDALPNQRVDHIDMDGLNNQRRNLRIVTVQQNAMNGKAHKDGTPRYRGVIWYKSRSRWFASISKSGQRKSLGYFQEEHDAAAAYDIAAKQLFGQYARLNFPEDT